MEMKLKKEKIIIEIISSYLYYGLGLQTFLEQNYEVAQGFTIDEIKLLWNRAIEKVGSEN